MLLQAVVVEPRITRLQPWGVVNPRHKEVAETIALDTTVMVQEEKLRSAKDLSLSQERIIQHQEKRIKHLIAAIIVLGCLLFLSMVYAIFMDKMVPRAGIFQYTVSETK